MTALHPEATADPQTLRWVTTPGALPVIGSVNAAPAPLAELLDEGLVTSLTAGPAWVDVALDPDQTWRSAGPRVRSALLAALDLPEQWHVTTAPSHRTTRARVTRGHQRPPRCRPAWRTSWTAGPVTTSEVTAAGSVSTR